MSTAFPKRRFGRLSRLSPRTRFFRGLVIEVAAISLCSGLTVCLPPRSLQPLQVNSQGSRGFYIRAERASLPSHASDMLSARLQAIGGTRTSTSQDSQLCRLLTPLPSFSERDSRNSPWPFARSAPPPSPRQVACQDSCGVWIPSNLWAMSLRYRPRLVSGLTTKATSARALRPSRLPISAKVDLCGSHNRNRGGRWERKIRFSATKYSFWSSNSLIDQAGDVRQQPNPFVFFHLDRP